MTIKESSLVSLSYTLTVDGEVVDQANAEQPLEFIFGMGMLLPDFEKNVNSKKIGDKFAFILTPEQGYGVINDQAVVDLPKDIFVVEGVLQEELLVVGNVLPMSDNAGNRMQGVVKEVKEDEVTVDFNHPLAGKTLNFEGEVVGVAESTDEDVAKFFGGGGEGCASCGSGGGCDSDCEDEGSCCK